MPEGVLLRPAAANTSKEKPLPQRPNTASSSDATETAGSPFSWTRSETDGHPSNNAAAEVHVVEHATDAAAAGATAQPAPAEANAHNEAAEGANDSSSSTLAPRPPGRRVPRSTLRGGGAAVTAISPRLNDNAYDAQTVSSSTVDATLHNSQSITTMGGRGAIEASFPSVGRNTNGGGSRPRDRIRSAASLREAVTTNLDRYAVFEKELLEEINLLRRAPNAYAALLEQQATLGYPFIHGDDVYFDADAIAETVHRPPVLPMSELLPEVSETPPPRGRASKKRPLTGGSSRDFQESPRSSSVEEGHLASAGGVDGCGTGEAATLKSLGMEQLNLVQLRTHFLRHQKRRMALEKALKEVMSQWQQAEQMQHDTWAAEDEKANKKKRATKDRKKSVSAPEDVYFARRTASEKLNTNYQSAVAVLAEDLRRTRATCRRTLQGANLILDCIRALKEARPAPPLRLSRGLTLASRDASRSYHCEIERVKALTEKHEQLLSSTMLGQFGQQAATTGSVAMYSGSQAIRATSLNISDGNLMHHGSLRGMSREVSAQDAAQAAATLASAETRERSGAEAMHLPDVAEGHHGSHEYAGFVEELLGDIHDLERSSRQTCADYGYVSGEVRGLQLYGVGSPRSLVMQMLLGVVTPVFSFTDKKSGGTMPPGMSYSFLSPSSASSPCSQMSRPNHGNSITDTCFEESMFNLHTSLTDDGRGEGMVPGQLTQLDSLIVTPPPALCGPPTKSITGLRYGGMYHPSSAAASAYMGAEEAKETTSAGKRAAKAVQRLGPLLWRDAHLFGCGWQRVFGELQTPTYQEHCLDTPYQLPIPPEDLNQVRVSTLVMVASGYEELDLIHQRKNFTLDEVRRMVHQDVARPGQEPQRSLRTSQSPRESVADSDCLVSQADAFHTKMDRPAVVDLHSSLDVTLLFPTSHPLIVPHGQSTVWIGLRADAQRVQLRACVSAVSEPLPTSPFLSSEEVLVQRSETDINVVLVLVDLRAAFARTQGNPLLINLYEMDKLANGEQGFEHIGFLRVVDAPPSGPVRSPGLPRHQRRSEDFPVSSRRQLRSAHSNATGATVEDTLPADLTDTKAALMADAPPDLRQLIRSLDFSSRPCSKPILSVADARKLPTLPASRGLTSGPTSAEAAMGSSLLPAAGGSPALYGWPAISQDFYDRCGTLLAPLCASLSPTDERRSIRVFLPLSEDYLEMQMESLRAVLEELRQVEAKELAEDEAEQIAEEQAAMAPPPTDSVDSGEEEESPMGSQLTGKDTKGKKDGKGHKASKAEAKKKAARRQSSVAKDKELRRTSFFTQAERDVRANLLLLPMSTLAPDFNERMSLRKLRSISEALHNDALVSRAQYTRAEDVLKSELSRLEKDLPKKKGKELLRLKHDEEDITRELEEMREKVEGVEAAALRASDEVLRRERNIALRKARILRTQAELSRLVAQTDRRVPLSVCLWFAGGTSVLPSSLSVKPIAAQMAEQDCKKTVVVDVLPPRHRRARSPPDVLVFGDSTGVSSSIMGDRNRSASSDTGFTKGLTAMGCSGTSIRSDSGAKSATRGPEDQRSMLETERFDDGQAGRIDTVRGTDTQDLSLSGRGVALPRIHRERNVVVLTATNSDLTLYEAEFTVPSGFNGRAVLLVEDQETISWMVSSE